LLAHLRCGDAELAGFGDGFDDVVQIGLHVLEEQIDVFSVLCLYGIV
jgi:hypothetical protein